MHVAIEASSPSPGGSFVVYDTRIPVRGAPIVNVYGPVNGSTELVIRPGRHTMSIKAGDLESAKWEVNASPGARIAHEFRIAPAPKPEEGVAVTAASPSRVGPLVLIGVGGAALVAGGVLGIVSLGKTHSLEDRCPNDTCPPSVYGDVDSARTYVRATDILLIGGGVVAAAGIGWFIFQPTSTSSSRRGGREPTFIAAPVVGPHGYGADLRLRF